MAVGLVAFGVGTAVGYVAGSVIIGLAAGTLVGAAYDYVMDAMLEDAMVDTTQNLTATAKDPIASKQIVYGKVRKGGTITYLESKGPDNKYLHQATVFAGHECDFIEEIHYNDVKVYAYRDNLSPPAYHYYGDYSFDANAPNAAPKFTYIDLKHGVPNQAALASQSSTTSVDNGRLPNDITTHFNMFGHTYAYTRFDLDADNPYSGQPNVTALLRGKKIYDPRKDNTQTDHYDASLGVSTHRANDSTTWQYSDNSALCVLDYLTDSDLGVGLSIDRIDLDSLVLSANVCDETVSITGGTQKRFTCNGVLDTKTSFRNNLQQILQTMNGKICFSGGKYHIDAYTRFTADGGNSYRAPHSAVLNEDIMVGGLTIRSKASRRDMYNKVKGTYVSSEENYIPVEYPTQSSTTFETQDGGELPLEMKLSMVTDHTRAQRLARLTLLRSRMQETIAVDCNLKALQYRVGDRIKFSNVAFGYSAADPKIYEISKLSIIPSEERGVVVKIEAKETAAEIYDWTASDATSFTTGTTVDLYDPTVVTAPTQVNVLPKYFRASGQNGNEILKQGVEVQFNAGTGLHLGSYRVTMTNDNWTHYQKVDNVNKNDRRVEFDDLLPNETYTVYVEAVNSQGKSVAATPVTYNTTDAIEQNIGGGGEFKYVATAITAPSDADFKSYFGQEPNAGDQLIVVQVDADGIVVDSATYVYRPELMTTLFDAKQTADGVNDSENAAYRSVDDNYDPKIRMVFETGVKHEDVTWSIEVVNFVPLPFTNTNTSPSNLTITELVDTEETNRAELVFTLSESDTVGKDLANSFVAGKDYIEQVQVRIKATYDNTTVTTDHNLFVGIYGLS